MVARMTEREFRDYLNKVGTREPHFKICGIPLCQLTVERNSDLRDNDEQWPEVRCPKCLVFRPKETAL